MGSNRTSALLCLSMRSRLGNGTSLIPKPCRCPLIVRKDEKFHFFRSAIQKIVEKDDCSGRPMVLCVSKIHEANETGLIRFLELTDGWYGIRAKIDSLLAAKVAAGQIAVGTKLFIVNAIFNSPSTDGISPLDVRS